MTDMQKIDGTWADVLPGDFVQTPDGTAFRVEVIDDVTLPGGPARRFALVPFDAAPGAGPVTPVVRDATTISAPVPIMRTVLAPAPVPVAPLPVPTAGAAVSPDAPTTEGEALAIVTQAFLGAVPITPESAPATAPDAGNPAADLERLLAAVSALSVRVERLERLEHSLGAAVMAMAQAMEDR